MRIPLAALLAIALAAGAVFETALAQDAGSGRKGRGGHSQNADQNKADQQKKSKAIDDAYKSAVTRMPDSKEKYDPWKNAR